MSIYDVMDVEETVHPTTHNTLVLVPVHAGNVEIASEHFEVRFLHYVTRSNGELYSFSSCSKPLMCISDSCLVPK